MRHFTLTTSQIVCCLAVAVAIAVVEDSPFARFQLRRYHVLNDGVRLRFFEQSWVGLAASLALTVLAAVELRGLLGRKG